MCGPAEAQAGMQAAGAIVEFGSQRAEARRVNAAFMQNQEASIGAYQDDIEANNLNTTASSEASTQRRVAAQREGLEARGQATASAAERGLAGSTTNAIRQAISLREGEQLSAIDRNQDLDEQRARMTGRGARKQAEARINQATRSKGPSLAGLAVNLGNAAVGGYTMNSQLAANRNQGT